jgi:hypothetical protein
MRVLYIQPSPKPPPGDLGLDRFVLLSKHLGGEVLQPVWYRQAAQVEEAPGPGSWPRYKMGGSPVPLDPRVALDRRCPRSITLWFFIAEARRAHREQPVDCVMVYSHLSTAFCGMVIKTLTGATDC